MLALMNKGAAATWRDSFLLNMEDEGHEDTFKFPTIQRFLRMLQESFKDTDSKANALYQLGTIRQGTHSIEEHNAKFSLLVSESNLYEDNDTILVNYYQ
jgi:hypothetical protein